MINKKDRLIQWYWQRTGRTVDPADIPWLMGPVCDHDAVGDRFIPDLAEANGLDITKNEPGAGLLPDMDALEMDGDIHPAVRDFYEHTTRYTLEVWTQWSWLFKPFGRLVYDQFSLRLQQLNLPQEALDTAWGITSDIFQLTNMAGETQYTVWYRKLKRDNTVIYSGLYDSTRLPDGRKALKVIFPLPHGNVTVILAPEIGPNGDLLLQSRGKQFGDPGLYVLLDNPDSTVTARYIQPFQETIHVYVDDHHILRANHHMDVFNLPVFRLHYKMALQSQVNFAHPLAFKHPEWAGVTGAEALMV